MSQPPYPFQPQQFPPGSQEFRIPSDPLAPARRAGIALIVIGSLLLLVGVCAGVLAKFAPFDQMPVPQGYDMSQLPPGMSVAQFMRYCTVACCVLFVPLGLLLLISGLFTFRGARWACILGVVACSLLLLLVVINVVSALARGPGTPQILAAAACMLFLPGAMLLTALIWLIQALRQFPAVQLSQQQYQMQLWQYQQQQAAYQQQPAQPPVQPNPNDPWQRGYGITPPPPPPPPSQPPQ